MTRTDFRPSIHGWPFGNSFKYPIIWGLTTINDVGFCGGMCWRALHYFYHGLATPREIIKSPKPGEPFYDELRAAQEESLSASKILKIMQWQEKPDLSDRWNPRHSLGSETQDEWDGIKVILDQYRPVTLTVITSSNDGNVQHFKNNHRVVAYAYDYLSISGDPIAPPGATKKIVISIYDPNFPMDDEVKLSFYSQGARSKILLTHNRGKEVHGFFLDDKDRQFIFREITAMQITDLTQTDLVRSIAYYDLTFSWQCRVFSYFNLLIDGVDWYLNSDLCKKYSPLKIRDQDNYEVDAIHKQVPARIDSLTLPIVLQRKRTTVAIKLLDSNDFSCYQVKEIDLTPTIEYQLHVLKSPTDTNPRINDNDLFIKNPNPTLSEIQNLDTSPSRWIKVVSRNIQSQNSFNRVGMVDPIITITKRYRLGNIKVPYLADFKVNNLVPPLIFSGDITINDGIKTSFSSIVQDQKIFDGFLNNPTDYDNDTHIDFNFNVEDSTNLKVQGSTIFFGRSIIYEETATTLSIQKLDPAKLARLEMIYDDLVERGLINLSFRLPGWHGPFGDPKVLKRKIQEQTQIQKIIKLNFHALLKDPILMKECYLEQISTLDEIYQGGVVNDNEETPSVNMLEVTEKHFQMEQARLDDVIIRKFVDATIVKFSKDPIIEKILRLL